VPLSDIKDALLYLWQLPVLRMLVIVDMFLGMLTFPYQRLLPGFVSEILADNPDETAIRMGLLLTVTGVGALFGSLLIASLPNKHRGKLVIGSVALFGLGLLAFSVSTVFYVSLGIVLIMGIGQAGRQALNNILIQSHTSNEFRGRISSIMLFEDGIESLGIFAIALLAAVVGPQIALGATALTMLALAAGMWFLMPSYRRLQ
jgi:ENTS family enterobactin (siderophore) exporter